jgi:hypothetical protein
VIDQAERHALIDGLSEPRSGASPDVEKMAVRDEPDGEWDEPLAALAAQRQPGEAQAAGSGDELRRTAG